MNRKLLALLIAASIVVGGKPFPANAQTEEPTTEVTPVVVESEPVVIPDDSTVVVIEAPEPEPEPAPAIDPGLLGVIAGVVLIGFFTLFGATVVKLGNSAPPWMVAALVGGVDAIKPSVDKWVATTPTTLDDSTMLEVWKEIDKLKQQVHANTVNIQNKTEPGK